MSSKSEKIGVLRDILCIIILSLGQIRHRIWLTEEKPPEVSGKFTEVLSLS